MSVSVIAADAGGSSPVGALVLIALLVLLAAVFVVLLRRPRRRATISKPGPTAVAPTAGYGYGSAVAPTNTMAILSLVFAFVFCPLAIVFGHVARKQIRERGESGSGLATSGLVLGYVFTAIQLVFWAGLLLVVVRANNGELN